MSAISYLDTIPHELLFRTMEHLDFPTLILSVPFVCKRMVKICIGSSESDIANPTFLYAIKDIKTISGINVPKGLIINMLTRDLNPELSPNHMCFMNIRYSTGTLTNTERSSISSFFNKLKNIKFETLKYLQLLKMPPYFCGGAFLPSYQIERLYVEERIELPAYNMKSIKELHIALDSTISHKIHSSCLPPNLERLILSRSIKDASSFTMLKLRLELKSCTKLEYIDLRFPHDDKGYIELYLPTQPDAHENLKLDLKPNMLRVKIPEAQLNERQSKLESYLDPKLNVEYFGTVEISQADYRVLFSSDESFADDGAYLNDEIYLDGETNSDHEINLDDEANLDSETNLDNETNSNDGGANTDGETDSDNEINLDDQINLDDLADLLSKEVDLDYEENSDNETDLNDEVNPDDLANLDGHVDFFDDARFRYIDDLEPRERIRVLRKFYKEYTNDPHLADTDNDDELYGELPPHKIYLETRRFCREYFGYEVRLIRSRLKKKYRR